MAESLVVTLAVTWKQHMPNEAGDLTEESFFLIISNKGKLRITKVQ